MKNAVLTARLRVLRAERRLSQMDTADAAGISHNRYWRIENGYTEPTEDEVAALATLFSVRDGELIQGAA